MFLPDPEIYPSWKEWARAFVGMVQQLESRVEQIEERLEQIDARLATLEGP